MSFLHRSKSQYTEKRLLVITEYLELRQESATQVVTTKGCQWASGYSR